MWRWPFVLLTPVKVYRGCVAPPNAMTLWLEHLSGRGSASWRKQISPSPKCFCVCMCALGPMLLFPFSTGGGQSLPTPSGMDKTLSPPCPSACLPHNRVFASLSQGTGKQSSLPALDKEPLKKSHWQSYLEWDWVGKEGEGNEGT